MSLLRVPIYPTRNLAVEIDPGARSIVAGTGVSFTTNADGSITINASSGTGTVTSVGATGSTGLTVGGSPITTSGTLTFTLSANLQSWSGIAPATKANLASPVFTGDPRAPTPATADNDTSIATTAFVKNQGYATTAALGNYVLKAGDTMTGQLLRTIAGMADNTNQLWLRAYSDNAAGEVSISYVRGAASSQGGINFNVANGAANNVTPLRLTPATGIPVFTTRVHNMPGAVNTQSVLRYMGWNNEVKRWAEVMESDATLSLYSYDSSGGAADRIMNLIGGSMGTKQVTITGARLVVDQGDLYAYRTGGTTGVIFLRSDGSRYLFYDGGKYVMPGAGLDVGGTIQSATRAITGLLGGEGFQMVWNTVQSGQGRTEFVNNRGGGSGGFTWWDRANTGAGTGTALAALTGAGLFVNGVVQFNTGGTSIGQLTAWPGNSSYVSLGTKTMGDTEYALLTANPSVDTNTYISSPSGGTVKIRPSANSTVGEATFSTAGLSLAKYVWPDANTAGSKKLSRISIGTAAPSGLIDGELYLRY